MTNLAFAMMLVSINAFAWMSIAGIPVYIFLLALLCFRYIPNMLDLFFKMPYPFARVAVPLSMLMATQVVGAFFQTLEVSLLLTWLANILSGVILFAVSFFYFNNLSRVTNMLKVVCLVQAISLMLGLAQSFFGIGFFLPTQYQSFDTRPGPAGLSAMNYSFASYFFPLVSFWTAFMLYGRHDPKLNKEYYWVSAVCGFISLIAILISNSRSGQLAIILAFLLSVVLLHGIRDTLFYLVTSRIGYIFSVILMIILYVWFEVKPISQDGELNYNSASRFILWLATFDIFNENILIGVGGGHVKQLLEDYFGNQDAVVERMPHNIVLQILAENGIFGAILFFAPFYYVTSCLYRYIQSDDNALPEKRLIALFVLNYFIIYFVDSMFHNTLNANMIWVLAGLGGSLLKKQHAKLSDLPLQTETHNGNCGLQGI